MSVSFWQKYSNYLGVFGFILGGYSGFIMRDEYNFSSSKKMEDILIEFQENSIKIQESRKNAKNHLSYLVEQENNLKKELESTLKKGD